MEAYGSLPVVDDVTLSPDGSKFAYVVPYQGRQAVIVATTGASSKIVGEMPGSGQKVRDLTWVGDDHLIVVKSQTGYAAEVESDKTEWFLPYVMDLTTRKIRPLLDKTRAFKAEATTMNVVTGELRARSIGGKPVVFVEGQLFLDSTGVAALFKVDVDGDRQDVVENTLSPNDRRSWIVDKDGALLAQITYYEDTKRWTLRIRRNGEWVDAYDEKASIDTPSVDGISRDGSALMMSVPTDRGYQVGMLSLADGKFAKADAEYDDFRTYFSDPVTHRIIGGLLYGLEGDYRFFAAADQAAWNQILAAFPGEQVELSSWSNDRRKVIVRVTGQTHGVVYALVDLATDKAAVLGQTYQGIGPGDVAAVETIAYKAADGRTVPAYLTLPNGRDPKKLPLVVLPHGGPAASDEPGFDWWAQALASRGYAVLQPQFRGSEGLGWDWEAAGFGQWGRKMQSDVSDGVRALARSGIIDPARVCIVGASYGGYAALAGVTLESGVYRCAVSVAGVADLRRMWGGWQANPSKDSTLRYWDRLTGVKDPNDPALDAISPIKHIDKISVPVLLIHGTDDTVVPFEQSRRMNDAMKEAGKPVTFVTLKSEDHWLSRSETRQQMLQETVKFLEANNPPG